jgi:hypothetical protein
LVDQAFLAQVKPNPVVKPIAVRVLSTDLDCRRIPAFHLGVGHVRVEKRATVGSILVDDAFAIHEPVAVAIGLASRNQHGKRLVGPCPQMLLGPNKYILAGRTQGRQIAHVEAARTVPAKDGTHRAAANGATEAELLPRNG